MILLSKVGRRKKVKYLIWLVTCGIFGELGIGFFFVIHFLMECDVKQYLVIDKKTILSICHGVGLLVKQDVDRMLQ